MRVIYLANSRIPTHKAHGLEIFKLCEALQVYTEVKLVIPRRINVIKDNPFLYYNIKRKFALVRIPVLDAIIFSFLGKFGFWIETISFSFFIFWYILLYTKNDDIILSHDNAPLLVASLLRKNIFYDVHDFPVRGLFFYKILMHRCRGIITTNEWKKNELIKRFSIKAETILVHPNGVEISEFNLLLDKESARSKLGISPEDIIIMYVGSFIYWKGVETLVRAYSFMNFKKSVYLVGGNEYELSNLGLSQKEISGMKLIGNRPHKEIPVWMRSADVLILPSTSKYNISKYYTSPMKLFEYMASGTPIIASDVPSVNCIVNDELVSFFVPDDPKDLAAQIQTALNDRKNILQKAQKAQKEVEKYTWMQRALHIKEFYEKKSNE